jgi:2-keto-4-pentenoate hydratase/2-oxohepta-3-ene-1,7-dioic acid hydratase in catechol pathway
LNRGDLIIFGTPDGVGAGIKPNPVFLKDGDIIELEIEGLGKQKHKVINQS